MSHTSPQPSGALAGDNLEISIVVPAYDDNRFHDLVDLIDSIRAQQRTLELVLVIEKSQPLRDKLTAHLENAQVRHKILFGLDRMGLAAARNIGAKESSGPVVAFVDDDAVLSSDWSLRLINVFKDHPEIIGVTGEVLPLWVGEPLNWFPQSLYWAIGCTAWRERARKAVGYEVAGVNMAFRKEAFSYALFSDKFTDGFGFRGKQGLTGDDVDFSLRLRRVTNRKILYTRNLRVYHKVYPYKTTVQYIRRYSFWQGMSEARYTQLYGGASRQNSRYSVFIGLSRDFFQITPETKKRVGVMLAFLVFGLMGYLSYQNKLLERLATRLL